MPAFSENKQLQVVVHTPAGSNHPQAYDAQKKEFKPAMQAGLAEQINFLPAPGNLGFIPSTKFKSNDNTEKPLAVMVLAESAPTGTVQEVVPIGTLILDTTGELTSVIIAVPARPSAQIIHATSLESFTKDYPAAKAIIQQWFLHYQPEKQTRLSGWKDEKYTEKFIQQWLL